MEKWYVVDDGEVYNVLSEEEFDPEFYDRSQVIKVTTNMDVAFNIADKLNRKVQEKMHNFSPMKGYYNESKSVKLTENQLQKIITESIKKILKEDFTNVDEYGAQFLKWAKSKEASKTTIMQDIYDYYDSKYNNNLHIAKVYFDEILETYVTALNCKPSELNIPAIKKAINYWGHYNYTPEENY